MAHPASVAAHAIRSIRLPSASAPIAGPLLLAPRAFCVARHPSQTQSSPTGCTPAMRHIATDTTGESLRYCLAQEQGYLGTMRKATHHLGNLLGIFCPVRSAL